MDRICQYSTIIFAGNVSVLILVAIATDYWEYRAFDYGAILPHLKSSNKTSVIFPSDTDSYVIIRYFWDPRAAQHPLSQHAGNSTFYQPPALLHKYTYTHKYFITVKSFNGTHYKTTRQQKSEIRKYEDVLYMFVQYGNLYRDCSNLEEGVRERLGLTAMGNGRCENFVLKGRPKDNYVSEDLPAVIHLERAAFVFCVICVLSSITSLISGASGSLTQDQNSILTASASALISGMSLTIAIAIFHGKCHLFRRREILEGYDMPFKKTINDARKYYYGWSFVLAWITVALCFIHTWVWLHKAQEIQAKLQEIRKKGRKKLQEELLHIHQGRHGRGVSV